MPVDGTVCHAHAAWACFPVKTPTDEDVDTAHGEHVTGIFQLSALSFPLLSSLVSP